ncbi:MAG: hypothetical protein QOH76_3938 [Thermoleophilaceae bacterium]|jgi:hypothetical protein|nr:hypothetical protein [Thermoleophilaceae bacterium]
MTSTERGTEHAPLAVADEIVVSLDGWRFTWAGERLADVWRDGESIACIQVGEYDLERGASLEPFTDAPLRAAAKDWVRDYGADYMRSIQAAPVSGLVPGAVQPRQ